MPKRRLTIRTVEFVSERVEVEAAGDHLRRHEFWGQHEGVRAGVRVVPPREVPVVRRHDRVLVSVFDVVSAKLKCSCFILIIAHLLKNFPHW